MKIFISFLGLFLFNSCQLSNVTNDKSWSELPNVTPLENLKMTEFVPTLENPKSETKNTIYAPSFLFAWNKIEEILASSIVIKNNDSNDINLLANSTSHLNSLQEEEYFVSVNVENSEIIANANFNKTLPFRQKLQLLDPISFKNESKVLAFGINYYDIDLIKFVKILYYKNDDNFVIQLIPKDNQHEIILVKGIQSYKTLSEGLFQSKKWIEIGKIESKDQKLAWKYKLVQQDILAIPIIKFNLAGNYKKLLGQQFETEDNRIFYIKKAFQRTGFILDENGAVVESEAEIAAVDSTLVAPPSERHPKKLIFDKPFLIVVKRREQNNPYFVMSINNSELMTKFQ